MAHKAPLIIHSLISHLFLMGSLMSLVIVVSWTASGNKHLMSHVLKTILQVCSSSFSTSNSLYIFWLQLIEYWIVLLCAHIVKSYKYKKKSETSATRKFCAVGRIEMKTEFRNRLSWLIFASDKQLVNELVPSKLLWIRNWFFLPNLAKLIQTKMLSVYFEK